MTVMAYLVLEVPYAAILFLPLFLSVCEALKLRSLPFTHPIYVASRVDKRNGVFSAAVNGGAEDSVMGSGLP